MPERIKAARVADITGLAKRTILKMANAGQIPSAAFISGVWTFREDAVRLWVTEAERKVACPAGSTARRTPASGTSVSSSEAKSYAEAYERLTGRRPRSAQPWS